MPFKNPNPAYASWAAMICRCYRPGTNGYHNYGGRGIKVCNRWRNSFSNFLADMGPRPVGMELGRIENNKGYSQGNCEWQTKKKNGRNKRTTLWCVCDGKLISCAEACEILKCKKASLEAFIRKHKPAICDVTGKVFIPRKKLTPDQVARIRSCGESSRTLAKRFSVSPTLIKKVRRFEVWKGAA